MNIIKNKFKDNETKFIKKIKLSTKNSEDDNYNVDNLVIDEEDVYKSEYDNEDMEELNPYRPELEKIKVQKIKLLKQSLKHPRTVYFSYEPNLNQNDKEKKFIINEFEIKEKKYMILYKGFRNEELCLAGTMNFNNIIKSKLFENTNLIWKMIKNEEIESFLQKLNKYQKFNHFPMGSKVSFKDNLYKNYYNLLEKFPKDYNYMPEAFIFPEDYDKFQTKIKTLDLSNKTNLWIIESKNIRKKELGILTDLDLLKNIKILTHYKSPHLINGKKYEIRLYFLITGFSPLKIYLFNDGIIKFCNKKYDLNELIKYSIDKNTLEFSNIISSNEKSDDNWTLEYLKNYFINKNIVFNKIWEKIKDIIIKTVISVTDTIIPIIKKLKLSSCNLFELFEVDILLDETHNPWLMRIAYNPSMNCDNVNLLKMKSKLITDIFNIIGIIPFSHDAKLTLLDKPNIYKNSIEEGIIESFL